MHRTPSIPFVLAAQLLELQKRPPDPAVADEVIVTPEQVEEIEAWSPPRPLNRKERRAEAARNRKKV